MTQRAVTIEGGFPWGFRIYGGADLNIPLKISRVNPASKASQAGIKEGDLITTINNQSTKRLTNSEAHQLIRTSGKTLKLGLNEIVEEVSDDNPYSTIGQKNNCKEKSEHSTVTSKYSTRSKETLKSTATTTSINKKEQRNNKEIETFKRATNTTAYNKDNKFDRNNSIEINRKFLNQQSSTSLSTPTSNTLVPEEGHNISSDQAVASRQSSYSNCSSIPDEGRNRTIQEMNDCQSISKSKRRRQRRKNNLLNRSISKDSQNNNSDTQESESGIEKDDDEDNFEAEINDSGKQEINSQEIKQETNSKQENEEIKDVESNQIKTNSYEILKLKRIEHKYKVESPKEIRIEQITSKDKKLKAKSKSLDDDDLLKIQELSEASESEDQKSHTFQSNVIISEASSDENLISDSDIDGNEKKSNRIGLNIAIEKEEELRSFIDGLNLINSPEESAKDLQEKTIASGYSKFKKHQTRKELEQYFSPMAQCPKFLDAISEENSSDVSDKEAGQHSNKIDEKQEDNIEQVPPPVPPRTKKSKLLKNHQTVSEQLEINLNETKVISPKEYMEDVCRTQTVPESNQQPEVVYLNESDSSVSGSEELEQAENKNRTTEQSEMKNEQSATISEPMSSNPSTTERAEIAGKQKSIKDIEILTEETLTTNLSSNHSSSVKVSQSGDSSKSIGETLRYNSTNSKQYLFDYTKPGNVLIAKEPTVKELNKVKDKQNEIKTTEKEESKVNSEKQEIINAAEQEVVVTRVSVVDENPLENHVGNDHSNKIQIENNLKETEKPVSNVVLRHIVMTSTDSNKTDTQKLKEFESICKINSELKTKIRSNQESFGAMRSQSIDAKIKKDIAPELEKDDVTILKNLVQKRVKEFSNNDHLKMTKENIELNRLDKSDKEVDAGNLVKSRVSQFTKANTNENKNENDGSVLKRFLSMQNLDYYNTDKKSENSATKCKNEAINEKIVPIILEDQGKTVEEIQEQIKKERRADIQTKSKENVCRVIPIAVEGSSDERTKNVVAAKMRKDISRSVDNVSCYKTYGDPAHRSSNTNNRNTEKIIPIKLEIATNTKTDSATQSSPEKPPTTNEINNESVPNKEILIPIKVENKTEKDENTSKIKVDEKSHRLTHATLHTNVLSPPRASESSGDSSDSGESSMCTAKYNPNSSIGDVASLTKEEIEETEQVVTKEEKSVQQETDRQVSKNVFDPLPLRTIVLDLLMSLPYGMEILKELSEVSKTIDSYTSNLPFTLSGFLAGINNDKNAKVSVENNKAMPSTHWYVDKEVVVGEYREKLPPPPPPIRAKISVDINKYNMPKEAAMNIEENAIMSPNRPLTIIKEEPNEHDNTNEFLYFEDNALDRLKAKNLNEWLILARNKSKSTSNLDTTNIPINNLRRSFLNTKPETAGFSKLQQQQQQHHQQLQRRCSLPQEFYEQQLWDIMEKEREIQRELEKLEDEKRKLQAEIAPSYSKQKQQHVDVDEQQEQSLFHVDDFYVSKRGDFAERRNLIGNNNDNNSASRPVSMPVFSSELFRQQMYNEYMDKYSEREERKQQKVLKISSHNDLNTNQNQQKQEQREIHHPIELEQEFMIKVKKKNLGRNQDETVDNGDVDDDHRDNQTDTENETINCTKRPVVVLDGDQVKSIETLPKHLQEFVDEIVTEEQQEEKSSIWSPGQQQQQQSLKNLQRSDSSHSQPLRNEPISPVWTPKSANSSPTADRKEFRPLHFRSPVLSRKTRTQPEALSPVSSTSSEPRWKHPDPRSSDTAINISYSLDRRLPTSQSSPGFFSSAPRLPRAQNPTVTLLQKAREGQLPRGAHYIDQDRIVPNDRPPIKYPGEILYQIKNEYTSESDSEKPRKMADLTARKFEGVGPTSRDGMPLILRSEVKDKDQSKWYKRMYDTIHKQKPRRDEFVTVKYKQKRAQYPYTSGYLSEPEPGAYDSDFTDYKYATLDRRRPIEAYSDYVSNNNNYYNSNTNAATMPRNIPNRTYSSSDNLRDSQFIKHKVPPGKIENYVPGRSSISKEESKKWWDEVMDIFDGWLDENSPLPSYDVMLSKAMAMSHLEQQNRIPPTKPRSFINQALKDTGYESDSTLVFKRKEDTAKQLSPREQKEVYKTIQKGGDVPLHGLRRPAPERPKETDLVEFFPISPTLTKIRIHKSIIPSSTECIIPQREFFCYPATVYHHNTPKTFASFKRTAPSSVTLNSRCTSATSTFPPMAITPPPSPPSPPKRRSSRNNTTLRLISTIKVKPDNRPSCKRHETCFSPGPSVDRTKVNYLKDKITCKMVTSSSKKKNNNTKVRVVQKVGAASELKSRITSSSSVSQDSRKMQSSTRGLSFHKSGSSASISKKSSTESLSSRTSTPTRAIASEKKKGDSLFSRKRLTKTSSEELLSPTQVKKAQMLSSAKTYYKKSTGWNSNRNVAVPIKVSYTEKGKNILKSSIKKPLSVIGKNSQKDSEKLNKSNLESSGRLSRKSEKVASNGSIKIKHKETEKSKKNEVNGHLKEFIKQPTGTDFIHDTLKKPLEILRQKEAITSNNFFQNLFLHRRKYTELASIPKNHWISEKTSHLNRHRAIRSEPSLSAMKVYLRNMRPVSDSKFIAQDVFRSRSASPKSVTFSDDISNKTFSKRSSSLPTKLVFSQTSRPVSPVVTKRGLKKESSRSSSKENVGVAKFVFTQTSRPVSPVVTMRATAQEIWRPPYKENVNVGKLVFSQTSRPVSPVVTKRGAKEETSRSCFKENISITPRVQHKLYFSETSRPISPDVTRKIVSRAPSCRKIMQFKQRNQGKESAKIASEYALYSCPQLKLSSTSLDSFKTEDGSRIAASPSFRNEKFEELYHFYNDIEKITELERKISSKPRRKIENETADYNHWMDVRSRERAENQLKHLYSHIDVHQRDQGFRYPFRSPDRNRWQRECDRGLRVKEKSVENIRDEFERLKNENSDLENTRRRHMNYSKDTYKPLWRGNSVISLASILNDSRSHSADRAAVRQDKEKHLKDVAMFSDIIKPRMWSSLSTEQVSNLKNQLHEIYSDYVVEVPEKHPANKYVSSLRVRRNSESSKPNLMSEDEKKLISQILSKEVLEKVVKKRKEDKLALPLVVGKEVLGAVASQEAQLKKTKKQEETPVKAMTKTNEIINRNSASETESGSTDESTKTVINVQDVQKKVEYFEKAKDLRAYVPTVYKAADDDDDDDDDDNEEKNEEIDNIINYNDDQQTAEQPAKEKVAKQSQYSKSCQNLKEFFGESELVKFATLPLAATRKLNYNYMKKPNLRATDISPIRTISMTNSIDSLDRSRSTSPYYDEAQALTYQKRGEVTKLRKQFEFFEDFFGEKKLKRSRSENDLRIYGHVDDLRRKYEYPVHSGRGRSRTRRGGGVVSPIWYRPEDRYMPHINIISKISSLYAKPKVAEESSKNMEELAEILGCPIGEVEKMKEKFDSMSQSDQISLMGHMYTSSPNLKELRDITPYLTANWIAHKYPRYEDNTRPLSSPDDGSVVGSRDVSSLRRNTRTMNIHKQQQQRSKSSSPTKRTSLSTVQLKSKQRRSTFHETERFEPSTSVRYNKEPELPPPTPPPPPVPTKSQGALRSQDQESPRKYVENEVTIHYKTPIRTEIKEYVSEDELAHRQAETMKKLYEDERKRKYLQVSGSLQELQDMKSRRHTDNFIPSQKSPIALNRYDDFDDISSTPRIRQRSPEPRLVAKALYNFVGHSAKELTFRKGDLIYVRRQIDKNWYEGELNAMIGLFPVNYVEIVPYDGIKTTPRKAHEGQARAKYNFIAQTHLELSLAKGELVTVTRKVDDNWFEGKIGGRKGIFPVSYVEVLIDPSAAPPPNTKPVASPAAHSLLLNGSAQGKESMGSHLYTPNISNTLSNRDIGYHHAKPVRIIGNSGYSTLPKTSRNPIDQTLHIETQSEPIPFRALYKYLPQNDDELELLEGDTVYVLEKCDDGWYVGSSERTGAFGTFPGNYVEKI